ncbi:MAG TPA: class I SAM-dependent methyltransferase [Gammaproteobacteria bacterium]|nr:class I SAM-dependent methyltransferase [Gammaproteobacteria bacterium]
MIFLSLEHWETYYRGGALATCPTDAAGGYDRELRDGWVEFFTDLPEDARILDVGTGNGVVALIALETASELGRRYEIHGTDLARVDPPRNLPDGARRLAGIQFHAGVATEKLPFEAESFDAVSGHYALEYAHIDEALAEIRRVLKPSARARFILHHKDSLLVQNAHRSLRQADWVLKETKIYRLLRRHIEAERKSRVAARKTWQELNLAAEFLQEGLREPGATLIVGATLDAVQKLLHLRSKLHPTALEREIDRVENELRASVRRLHDLVDRARRDTDMAAIEAMAREAGLEVTERVEQYHDGDNLVGWRLTLERG